MANTGYSRTPKLLKGALIYFGAPMLIPIPNIIIFQYNPETMTRTLTPWQPPQRAIKWGEHDTIDPAHRLEDLTRDQRLALSQPYDPAETFSLVLELDATDALESPDSHPVATVSGVADRIAAIEMLLYPPGDSVLGGLLGSVAGSVSFSAGGLSGSFGADTGVETQLARREVPIVLFFWGPGRIVPVRITSLSIEEQQFSPLLYPIRAKASIGLKVLDLDDLVTVSGDPASGATVDIAKACYMFTRGQKEVLAMANLANSVESIIGMLPI
ncbi:hypothetical protein SAMN02745857_00775 [Andreprevotia lacus DSM 23236]|jgi:hypothetical protein|uniref:Uncharacterized protein n=1 Tax=Andreprevotia lacus DSM 23236 TaxID=1121001 RepID=A0A1W1X7D1_9NEIS|nr:hypothetical protein [Andreprevotia lacus]SMC19723.1 hypothetical protein SAMN02745857_00775 [Andreprevotia lacus DSM 23236]